MVLKVITIYNKDTDSMEEVLLEELQVFKVFDLQVFTEFTALHHLPQIQHESMLVKCPPIRRCQHQYRRSLYPLNG